MAFHIKLLRGLNASWKNMQYAGLISLQIIMLIPKTITWFSPLKTAFLNLEISFSWARISWRDLGMFSGSSFKLFLDRYSLSSFFRGAKAAGLILLILLLTRINACGVIITKISDDHWENYLKNEAFKNIFSFLGFF